MFRRRSFIPLVLTTAVVSGVAAAPAVAVPFSTGGGYSASTGPLEWPAGESSCLTRVNVTYDGPSRATFSVYRFNSAGDSIQIKPSTAISPGQTIRVDVPVARAGTDQVQVQASTTVSPEAEVRCTTLGTESARRVVPPGDWHVRGGGGGLFDMLDQLIAKVSAINTRTRAVCPSVRVAETTWDDTGFSLDFMAESLPTKVKATFHGPRGPVELFDVELKESTTYNPTRHVAIKWMVLATSGPYWGDRAAQGAIVITSDKPLDVGCTQENARKYDGQWSRSVDSSPAQQN